MPAHKRKHSEDVDCTTSITKVSQKSPLPTPISKVEQRLDLLKTGKWSDYAIICQTTIFAVHRVFLIGRSPFFDQVLHGPFSETSQQQLFLSEGDPEIIDLMLRYIYMDHFDFDRMGAKPATNWEHRLARWVQAIRLHTTADFLVLPDLQSSVFRLLSKELIQYCSVTIDDIEYDTFTLRSQFSNLFELVFDDNDMHERIKELIGWIAMLMNQQDLETPLLDDAHVKKYIRNFPELGNYMYIASKINQQMQDHCCPEYHELSTHITERWLPIRTKDND